MGSKPLKQHGLDLGVLCNLSTSCPTGLMLQEPRQVRKEAALTVVLNAWRVAGLRVARGQLPIRFRVHSRACSPTFFLRKKFSLKLRMDTPYSRSIELKCSLCSHAFNRTQSRCPLQFNLILQESQAFQEEPVWP